MEQVEATTKKLFVNNVVFYYKVLLQYIFI